MEDNGNSGVQAEAETEVPNTSSETEPGQTNGDPAGEETNNEKDPGTPVGDENDSDDSDDDEVQITIDNVALKFPPTHKQIGKPSQKLDVDGVGQINGKPIYDVDLESLEDKPWRKPGADLTDYFNYGFTEETWAMYCERQKRLRSEFGVHANRVLFAGSGPLGIIDRQKFSQQVLEQKLSQPHPIVNLAANIPVVHNTIPTVNVGTTPSVPVPIGAPGSGATPPHGEQQHETFEGPPLIMQQKLHASPNVEGSGGGEGNIGSKDTGPPGVDGTGPPSMPISTLSADGPKIGLPIDMSVPPPALPPTNVPPPGFRPGMLAPRTMPGIQVPTMPPPPGLGLTPQSAAAAAGYAGFNPRPSLNIRQHAPGMIPPYERPPGERGFAGFGHSRGDRSPASYSDKSSDVEEGAERDRYRTEHRRERSSRRRSVSPHGSSSHDRRYSSRSRYHDRERDRDRDKRGYGRSHKERSRSSDRRRPDESSRSSPFAQGANGDDGDKSGDRRSRKKKRQRGSEDEGGQDSEDRSEHKKRRKDKDRKFEIKTEIKTELDD